MVKSLTGMFPVHPFTTDAILDLKKFYFVKLNTSAILNLNLQQTLMCVVSYHWCKTGLPKQYPDITVLKTPEIGTSPVVILKFYAN